MFREAKDEQLSLFDRVVCATAQAKTAVEQSRAKLIGDVVYPNIDERKFSGLFSGVDSRPNIPVRQYVCALVLKRAYGLSDEVMLELLRCGALNFQYALHTTNDDEQPLSESSLRRFRRRIEAYNKEHNCDLIKEEYTRISRLMAVDMGLIGKDVDTDAGITGGFIVRMDSMEIEAHAKAMSRIEIVYTSTAIILRYLCKKGFENIIPEAFSHYFDESDKNKLVYHRSKSDQSEGKKDTRLKECVQEMCILKSVMEESFSAPLLDAIPEYQVFLRVFDDQTKVDQDGNIVPKDSKEILPSSVQNPFDETVTYRNKKGAHHGFVLNVAEAVDDNGNGIIIDADIDQNIRSDASLAEAYMERQPDNGSRQTLIADGAYNSDQLDKLAEKKNIDIQTTALTGAEPWDIDADFVLNEEGTAIVSCPCGIVPLRSKYNAKTGLIVATMPNCCCASCPHVNECNNFINERKKTCRVHLTKKMVKRAKQARSFSTEEGKANARRRNGVEGIMSVLRRKYHVDQLPVFGLDRYKPWIWATLIAYNLAKYQKYLFAQKRRFAMA